MIEPPNPKELAETLRLAAANKRRLRTGGRFTKHLMAGPNDQAAEVTITTAKMNRILQYEPADLTISVEAGLTWRELTRVLAENGQMLPLDPPFSENATVGGVLASNTCGPRRRQYGTARDLVIGMQFAMLNGKLVQSGGMVVKNVAGLDMGKLLIGSFGTLAVITTANFKVIPAPPTERTFAIEFTSLASAIEARDKLIGGALQAGAIDLMNPILAAENGFRGYTLLLWFGGTEALMSRCEREMVALGPSKTGTAGFWETIQNLTPHFLAKFPVGAVVRISSLITEVPRVLEELQVPAISRAGTGVTYAYFHRSGAAAAWLLSATTRGRKAVMEFASESARVQYDTWPSAGTDFEMMKRIKTMFDPDRLLNRGRLYSHL